MNPPQTESHGLTVTRIEALGFRSLRYVSQRLEPFHVLVGPNASGKSAFLDVLAFLGDLHRVDLEHAIMGYEPFGIPRRATDPRHLTWMGHGTTFELAVEAAVPDALRERSQNASAGVCRYEIAVDVSEPFHIVRENLWLKPEDDASTERERPRFPEPPEPPEGIVADPENRAPARWRRVVVRESHPENVTFRPEATGRPLRMRILPASPHWTACPRTASRLPRGSGGCWRRACNASPSRARPCAAPVHPASPTSTFPTGRTCPTS